MTKFLLVSLLVFLLVVVKFVNNLNHYCAQNGC